MPLVGSVLFFIEYELHVKPSIVSFKLPCLSLKRPNTRKRSRSTILSSHSLVLTYFLTQSMWQFPSASVPPRYSCFFFCLCSSFAFYISQDTQPHFYTQDPDYTRTDSGKYFIVLVWFTLGPYYSNFFLQVCPGPEV